MKKNWLLLVVLALGMLGLFACGQPPSPQGPGSTEPTAGASPSSLIPRAPDLAPPAGTVLLQDGFDNAETLGSTWSSLDISFEPGETSLWTVADGALGQGGTNLRPDSPNSAFLTTLSGADWTDYTARVSFYVEDNEEVGLAVRVSDSGFYRFRMRSAAFDGPYQLGLDLYQSGHYTVLWHGAKGGFPEKQWFTIEMSVKGTTLTVSVDGQVVTTVEDATLARGGIALYARAEGGVFFDNAIVAH